MLFLLLKSNVVLYTRNIHLIPPLQKFWIVKYFQIENLLFLSSCFEIVVIDNCFLVDRIEIRDSIKFFKPSPLNFFLFNCILKRTLESFGQCNICWIIQKNVRRIFHAITFRCLRLWWCNGDYSNVAMGSWFCCCWGPRHATETFNRVRS